MTTRSVLRRGIFAVAAATALTLASAACSGSGSPGSSPSGTGGMSTASPPIASPGTASPNTGTGQASSPTITASPTLRAGYLPLWPFPDGAAVLAWQKAYGAGGTQPWHRSERETALAFARGYLGYTEIDRVTGRSGTSTDALVGVGWADPNGKAVTVGTVHLLRFGLSADAPWEVVGTRDAALSLAAPRYGSAVTSPMKVGGRITGVDESLRVVVRMLPASDPLAESAPLPAGGENTPWSAAVAFEAPVGALLIVAASTGGHLMAVERFAVTGVRNAITPAVHGTWGSGEKSGGTATSAPLVNVRAARHTGYDRVVFDVAGEATGFRVRNVDQVTAAGSGTVIPVTGDARLQISVLAPAHDPERLVTYYLPDDRTNVVDVSGYTSFRQLAWAGSYKGHTEFGLGVRGRLPFRAFVMAGPNGRTMLVVDVAHTWRRANARPRARSARPRSRRTNGPVGAGTSGPGRPTRPSGVHEGQTGGEGSDCHERATLQRPIAARPGGRSSGPCRPSDSAEA